MRLAIILIVTFYCLHHHVSGNQQTDDPNRPFWAARGRRSGGRLSIKADDYIPDKWADDEPNPVAEPVLDKDAVLRKREQATSLLQSLLNALSTWDNEVVKKRGDSKTADPNNPFWAARG